MIKFSKLLTMQVLQKESRATHFYSRWWRNWKVVKRKSNSTYS